MPSKAEPLTDAELTAYEAKRDLAAELLESVREMKAGKGEVVLSLAVEARRRGAHPAHDRSREPEGSVGGRRQLALTTCANAWAASRRAAPRHPATARR